MPERFEIYIVYKRRYINMLPFLSLHVTSVATGRISCSACDVAYKNNKQLAED